MNIDELFEDTNFLDTRIDFFLSKGQLRRIDSNLDLVDAHMDKSKHNMRFFSINQNTSEYNDWLVVVLYYALYHSALALVVNKNFVSKNHTATLFFIIKNYNITKDEARLINTLSVSKEDAEFYTSLKNNRHDASYATNTLFTDDKILTYRQKVIIFIQKVEMILMR